MRIESRPIIDREEWLTWRRQDVTASVVYALRGEHPYITALQLYAEKRGVEFPPKDNASMRRGRWLEPAVAKAVSELRPDWTLEPPETYLRDPELRLGATPDYLIEGDPRGPGILQAKTAAPSVLAREWDNGREVPEWIKDQATVEAMLTGSAFAAVAVIVVDPYQMDCKIFEFPRDSEREAKIITAVKKFWESVETGEEPDPNFARDADLIKTLTPKETPGLVADFAGNNAVPEMLSERADLMERIKIDEARKTAIEAEIKFLMADAELAIGVPGWSISYKTQHRSAYTVPEKDLRVLNIRSKRAQI